MSEQKSIDRKNSITFTELDSRDIKGILERIEREGSKPIIDVEYAFKLASTLRWRTWPEEQPEDWRDVLFKRPKMPIEGGYVYYDGVVHRTSLPRFHMQDGDQWMYLSDLEVVR